MRFFRCFSWGTRFRRPMLYPIELAVLTAIDAECSTILSTSGGLSRAASEVGAWPFMRPAAGGFGRRLDREVGDRGTPRPGRPR